MALGGIVRQLRGGRFMQDSGLLSVALDRNCSQLPPAPPPHTTRPNKKATNFSGIMGHIIISFYSIYGDTKWGIGHYCVCVRCNVEGFLARSRLL